MDHNIYRPGFLVAESIKVNLMSNKKYQKNSSKI